ncbi:MAG: hypothetical protein GXY85_06085 [Candidatus Brocadiaceae bacterium]|nr:hypothetical protein [Candidatus Brocadiaceae bacterium]
MKVKKTRSRVFIIAGVCCALLAVVVLQKGRGSGKAPKAAPEGSSILLASRDIAYGELLVPAGQGGEANVTVVNGWPSDHKPGGALTAARELTERPMRAAAPFVRDEVILKAKVIPEDEFIPAGLRRESITVDQADTRSGRIRPGMLVDVLQIVNKEPRPYMRNVRVYAVGAVDSRERPVQHKEPDPIVHLLVKAEDHLTFLGARLKAKFMLMPATDPTIEGPLLVDATVQEEAMRAEIRELLVRGGALMAAGDYEGAHSAFRQAAELHPSVGDLSKQAAEQAAQCRQKLAMGRYEQARRALEEDKDYTLVLHHLDTIANEFGDVQSVITQASELRRRTEEARSRALVQDRYANAVRQLEDSLKDGNLPRARELLADLKQLQEQGVRSDGATEDLATEVAGYERRVREAAQAFESDRMVLESFVRQQKLPEARDRLRQMKQKFPRHPDLPRLEASVPAE